MKNPCNTLFIMKQIISFPPSQLISYWGKNIPNFYSGKNISNKKKLSKQEIINEDHFLESKSEEQTQREYHISEHIINLCLISDTVFNGRAEIDIISKNCRPLEPRNAGNSEKMTMRVTRT